MRILHYALGFPPYRTGGLTKYCVDLMLTQAEQGHEVALLWPGQITRRNGKTKIRKRKDWNHIGNFELINPLPVPLDEGILDIDAYMKDSEEEVYLNFLNACAPDVIHIHTLMGLHKAFLQAAKHLKIRTVFTTHDYFGICPKVTLYHHGHACDNDHGCADCVRCNESALSLKKIALLQSPLYRNLKNTGLVKMLRHRHRKKYFEEKTLNLEVEEREERKDKEPKAQEYRKLREYYISMLKMMDFIHFNSSVTEKVYKRYLEPKMSSVISITHRNIKDHRKEKAFDHDKLRIAYLGPANPLKGLPFLIRVLDDLWNQKPEAFELHLYSQTDVERAYITHRQCSYSYEELEKIFDDADVFVVPSQWYETFGFTVLEGLSYGVPVIVTDKVGAKDIIEPGAGIVVDATNADELYHVLCGLDAKSLHAMNRTITKRQNITTLYEMENKIEKCYQREQQLG